MKSKWIILILTAVLVFSAALSSSLAESGAENAIPLVMSSGEKAVSAEASVEIGETAYFSFCPSETGYYSIYPTTSTDSDSWNEPSLTLYDSGLNELTYESATLYGDITFELDAGALYYIGATVSDGESPDNLHRFTVNVERIRGLICASAGEVTPVHPGQPFTMTVDTQAEAGTILTYQWKESNTDTGNYEAIPDATSSSCTIQYGKRSSYACTVSDQYGRTKNAYFEIYVDNNLTVDDSATILVPYGETATLETHASCLDGDLTYEWYQNWTLIEGENSASLETSPVTSQTEYECTVRDIYDNSVDIVFSINVDNHFRVVAVLINGETVTDTNDIQLPPGTPVIAEVQAVCDNGELHYTWKNGETVISDAKQSILNYDIPQERFIQLSCFVEDEFGNNETVYFSIYINNHIRAVALSGTVDDEDVEDDQDYIYSTVTLDIGDSAILAVEGHCDVGSVHYQWYTCDRNYTKTAIAGQNSNTFPITDIDRTCFYCCAVYDDYTDPNDPNFIVNDQDVFWVYFDIIVDNLILTEPTDTEIDVFVIPGEAQTLSVKASARKGSVYYEWYRGNEIVGRPLSHQPSLSVTEYHGLNQYYCVITDDYNNRAILRFCIHANNGLYAVPTPETVFALPGQNAEFAVHTSVIMGPLTFKWYDSDGNLLPSTSDIATVQAPAERGEYTYTCQVKDAYENKRTAEFTLIVGEPYTLSPGQSITVTPDLPYAYFSFAANETAFYSFTVSGQANRAKLELFDLPGDDYHRSRDQMVQRLYSGRNYYYRVETASPSFTAALERIPDIPCGDCTLRKGQQVILPASIGEEDLTVNLCESADPPILSVSDHTASAQAEGETLLYAICDGQQGVYRITVADPQEGIFTLPANLTILGGSAFAGVSGVRYAELNDKLPVLPTGTFTDTDLVQLVVHGSQTVIEDGAFSGTPLILCPEDSKAAEYAREKGLPWLYLAKED